jgi:hypothetical protein
VAELHVGEGQTYASPARAAADVVPGDTVIVHAGVYRPFRVTVNGVTWRAAPGESPVIDGGWKRDNLGNEANSASGIFVSSADVVISGFEIRDVPGRGVAIGPGARNVTLEDFHIHHTFHGGVIINGMGRTIRNVTVRRGVVEYVSLSTRWRETPVNACFPVRDVDGILIEDVTVQYGGGEGLAAGTNTRNFTARRVTVANTKHLAAYANRAQDVLFEDCVFRQDGIPEWMQRDGDAGAGIVVGDEVNTGVTEGWQHADRVTFRRCVSVGTGNLFALRNNNTNQVTDGYDTTIRELTVENCTFIARPWTRAGVGIQNNPRGNNVAGVFRGNVFITDQLEPGASVYRSNAGGVRFTDNAWTDGVPTGAGIGDGNMRIDASALVAPLATPFVLDNARPVAGSIVAVNGWGALTAQGEPPPPPPPPDPDEDVIDWDALIVTAQTIDANLASVAMALDAAQSELAALRAELEGYKAA